MKADVSELLVTLEPDEDPLDALMGLRWAQLDLGRVQRVAISNAVRAQRRALEDRRKVEASSGGARERWRAPASIGASGAGGKPQAMVKLISGGGTSCRRGLGGQMGYLRKEGRAELERSERFMGIALDAEGERTLAEQWGLPTSKSDKQLADRTTHFVVSFPEGTEHGAAYRAGRVWADTLFGSGEYGDTFDYYTAFHTDRAHPHLHVVVNRRGLDEDTWLKVSKRSAINYDELRYVQVEVAAREGIELEATPRLSRGAHERRVPDAEVQRARAQGRDPVGPEHTALTAVRTAVLAHDYVRLLGGAATSASLTDSVGDRSNGLMGLGTLSQRSARQIEAAQERREGRARAKSLSDRQDRAMSADPKRETDDRTRLDQQKRTRGRDRDRDDGLEL